MAAGMISIQHLRAWWAEKQGLNEPLAPQTPAAVLARSGWARSVGGSAPYLSLHARADLTRAEIDASVARLEIHELPSARGCTYVVPAADYPLALTLAALASGGEMNVARKLGVTDAEVDALCDAVLAALGPGEAAPDEIRERVGGKARSLGAEGQKKGLSSTLPLALGRLQVLGEIRRVPVNGRLDQQRYRYARWTPLRGARLDPEEAYAELARRYFEWTGAATLAGFQWFSGLSGKAAKAAIAPLGLVPIDADSGRLATPANSASLSTFHPRKTPVYRLIPALDALALLRRDHASLLDASDAARELGLAKSCATLSGTADLPTPIIVDRGRIVGVWEYDPGREQIAWFPFLAKNAELEAAVRRTGTFIREELGDARGFSLDSPQARAPRIAAIRAAGK
jgi:hypothetical protein